MWRQSVCSREKPNKSKDFAILGMGNIHFGERILFRKRERRENVDKKIEYAEQWEISSKYFYDKKYYNWMQKKIENYNIILEVGCGTGYSTLALLENGHKVIVLEKNNECIKKATELIQQKGYSVGKIPDADVCFIETDVVTKEFYLEVLKDIQFDAVICWNVGSYWDKENVQFYLPYMLEYGLNIDQIKENVESSYGELILWNACKIATMRNVPVHIIERSGEIITESNCEYYRILGTEFGFSELEFDNLQADSISGGGRVLVTNGNVNMERIVDVILVSILMTF